MQIVNMNYNISEKLKNFFVDNKSRYIYNLLEMKLVQLKIGYNNYNRKGRAAQTRHHLRMTRIALTMMVSDLHLRGCGYLS